MFIVTYWGDSRRGFGLDVGLIGYLRNVIISKYNSLMELHILNISATTARIKLSQSHLLFPSNEFEYSNYNSLTEMSLVV